MSAPRSNHGPAPAELDPAHVRLASPAFDAAPPAPLPAEIAATASRSLPVVVPPRAVTVPRRRWLGRVFGWSLTVFVTGMLALNAWNAVEAAVTRNLAVGVGLGVALALATVTGAAILFREIIGFEVQSRRLHEVSRVAARAVALAGSDDYGKALPLANDVLAPYRSRADMTERIDRFRRLVSTAHSDRQVIELLSDTVIRPLDQEAYARVTRGARDAAVGVALVPFGLLDAGIAAWRALRMVREVADVYGFHPGWFGRMALLRRVLSVAATAGASDFVGDALLAHMGAKMAGMLSARIGEGLLTGLRTARLGVVAMSVCRPLPFAEQDRPAIARLSTELLKALPGQKADS